MEIRRFKNTPKIEKRRYLLKELRYANFNLGFVISVVELTLLRSFMQFGDIRSFWLKKTMDYTLMVLDAPWGVIPRISPKLCTHMHSSTLITKMAFLFAYLPYVGREGAGRGFQVTPGDRHESVRVG